MTREEIDELVAQVEDYAARRGGKMYAPIEHPAFEHIACQHGHGRFEAIAPHIPPDARTALDIGTHWGYFAHRLERFGLDVTAAENMESYLPFLGKIRELHGDRFTIWPHSVFDLPGKVAFDVVLAFNIFHHFIKTEETCGLFVDFLGRMECKVMFFQAHFPGERQMQGAFRNFPPDEFVEFLIANSGLTSASRIEAASGAGEAKRPLFKLTR